MSRCEAMLLRRGRYVPCGIEPADLHHKLTRARGGLLLDAVGETHHVMRLCREHHDYAHSDERAYDGGLLIRGSVVSGTNGRPVYVGPDPYLLEHYGDHAR